MHILYLEDSEPDIALIQQYMSSVDHQFTPVEAIEVAREYLQTWQPEVFLVDIVIGKEMAYELIRQVAQQGWCKHIIAVTAKALPADRKRCLDMGCDQILAKPFTIDDLEYTLSQLS